MQSSFDTNDGVTELLVTDAPDIFETFTKNTTERGWNDRDSMDIWYMALLLCG